jgi:hypothetical protein
MLIIGVVIMTTPIKYIKDEATNSYIDDRLAY